MYNDTIKVANKIISTKDLQEIFEKMKEEAEQNSKIYKKECSENEKLEWDKQNWTMKDFKYSFSFIVDLYDNTNITFDNYIDFITIFNNRLHEIKYIMASYSYNYFIQNESDSDYIHQSIDIHIWEDKLDIYVNLSSKDKKMNSVYELIKEKIKKAPRRYDKLIKNKKSIINKIEFGLGMIPSIIICTLLLLIPTIREFSMILIIYPLSVVILGIFLGTVFIGNELSRLYSPIVPNKKYDGFNEQTYESIYKDDLDDYVQKSEILIGKNVNNIKNRIIIRNLDKKYSKYIPFEIIAVFIITMILILLK